MSDLKQNLQALRLRDADLHRPRRRWPLVAGALAIVGLAAFLYARATAAIEVEVVRATVRQPAEAGRGRPILTASGYVVARRRAVVSAKIQGRLAELRVEEGSRVTEGEVIARLESRDYAAMVARARAQADTARRAVEAASARVGVAEVNLAEARRQASVAEQLWAGQVGSADERDAARSRVAAAEAVLAQARADLAQARAQAGQAVAEVAYAEALLDNTVIRAPFTGTVVRKMAEVGESVAPIPPGVNISTASGAIVALADLDTLEVEVDVAEANVARLRPEQPAEVVVEAFPDRRYRAVLRQVIPSADRTRATVMVKVTILDKDRDLKPEMSARTTFLEPPPSSAAADAPRTPVVLVPRQALRTDAGRSRVFEVTDGNIVRVRPVVVGTADQDLVEIKEGLSGGERLVRLPPPDLEDGARVRVKG